MHEATLALFLLALGDALMGEMLADSLGVERETARAKAEAMLMATVAKSGDLAG